VVSVMSLRDFLFAKANARIVLKDRLAAKDVKREDMSYYLRESPKATQRRKSALHFLETKENNADTCGNRTLPTRERDYFSVVCNVVMV